MIWLWISLALILLLLCLVCWSACCVAASADKRTDHNFQQWLEGCSQSADGLLYGEEAVNE